MGDATVPHAPSGTKGEGCGPLPLETLSQRDGGRGQCLPFGNQPPRGRETRDGGAAVERGSEGVLFAARCAPHLQMRGRTDLRIGYSAAGRRLLDLVGSSWRPAPVLGELTALPVNSSLSVFSFDHEWPFSFPQEEKKMGIPSRMVSPYFPVPQSGTL